MNKFFHVYLSMFTYVDLLSDSVDEGLTVIQTLFKEFALFDHWEQGPCEMDKLQFLYLNFASNAILHLFEADGSN